MRSCDNDPRIADCPCSHKAVRRWHGRPCPRSSCAPSLLPACLCPTLAPFDIDSCLNLLQNWCVSAKLPKSTRTQRRGKQGLGRGAAAPHPFRVFFCRCCCCCCCSAGCISTSSAHKGGDVWHQLTELHSGAGRAGTRGRHAGCSWHLAVLLAHCHRPEQAACLLPVPAGASPVAISASICRLSFSSLRRSLCWSVLYCRHCIQGQGGRGAAASRG